MAVAGMDLEEATVVVRWASSPDGRLLVGVTAHGIYLWSLKPFVLLSSLIYDPVDDFGQMVDVIWKDMDEETMEQSTPVREIYDNPLAQICNIVWIGGDQQDERIELYLFSDGSVHMIFSNQNSQARHGDGESAVVRTLKASDIAGKFTSIAYSPVSQVVAVGTSSGEVLLYTAGAMCLDLVSKLAFDHGKTARVSALSWTPDGSALACGYSTGHIIVRSVLGYELNATLLASQQLAEYLTPAPSLMAWVAGSTRLVVFSDCLTPGEALGAQQIDALPFARASLATVPSEGNSKRVCLFSDEKIFLYHCEFEAQDLSSQQPELFWHAAHIPPQYITGNWPIKYVAADDDGQHVAVAGVHGLAYYNMDSHKWRMFRNQQQEASISCTGGLLWYREYLVVACINHEFANTPQLLFFPRNKPLDMTSDLHTVALESPVVTMNCHNSMLLVYCRNMVVYHLLENFVSFYDIVVHCARKTEAAFWSRLFECVGGPERLFRQCLANDLLETATQCLIILQTLEPASVNEDNILALLAKVVAAKNRRLCMEILRFLKMTAESDPSMQSLLASLRSTM
ncbi:WD40 repeat protein [Dipsacomyces acuminosporus]|nr:WD40 repeat protein [Dipsacomyces acuminosporus]